MVFFVPRNTKETRCYHTTSSSSQIPRGGIKVSKGGEDSNSATVVTTVWGFLDTMDDHPSDERRALLVKDYAYDDDDSERLVASSSSSSSASSNRSTSVPSSSNTRTKSLLAIGVTGMVACACGGKAAAKTLLRFGAGQRGDAVRVFVFFFESSRSLWEHHTAASFFWTFRVFVVFFVFFFRVRENEDKEEDNDEKGRRRDHRRFCSSSSLSSFIRSSLSKSFCFRWSKVLFSLSLREEMMMMMVSKKTTQ